jgi:hypothetical protein
MAFPAELTDRTNHMLRIRPEGLVAKSSSVVAESIVLYYWEIRRYYAPGPDAGAPEMPVKAGQDH